MASGDWKISIDGGAFANLGTLPVVTPVAGKAVKIVLSQAETNGDNLMIIGSDAAGAEWADFYINIQTTARHFDDLAFPATSGRSMVVDAAGLVDANMVKAGPTGAGSAITARDIGASVLLSTGTGAGQLDFTSGVTKANVTQWNGTNVSAPATAGIPEVNVKNINNVATTPVTTVKAVQGLTTADVIASVTGAVGSVTGAVGSVTGNVGGNVGGSVAGNVTGSVGSVAAGGITATSIATDAIDADALAADAITEIWAKAMSDLVNVPGVTASALDALNWLYELARNAVTQTSTITTVMRDDGATTLATSTISDNGTTFSRGEFV